MNANIPCGQDNPCPFRMECENNKCKRAGHAWARIPKNARLGITVPFDLDPTWYTKDANDPCSSIVPILPLRVKDIAEAWPP